MEIFNPIKFANDVNTKFLNYQLTAFPLSDPDLSAQARQLLKGGVDFQPLIKGPYVSISRSFKWGENLKDLAASGIVHPALPGLSDYPQLFMHQYRALMEVSKGRHCLISTGTGSGKTEAFLFPILNHCLKLRDNKAPEGIVAVLVYPMNALAKDQLDRLRYMLAGSGITFGMYIGTTASYGGNIKNVQRMEEGQGKPEYIQLKTKFREQEMMQVSPVEERLTEEEISANPPRILITNVKQLELLMTRPKDIKMFLNSPLKYMVFDEAHTYSGIAGAEVSCLIRRLRSLAGKNADEVICIGTSATIADPDLGPEAGKIFAHRFFGVDIKNITTIEEEYETEKFPIERYKPALPSGDVIAILEKILKSIESTNQAMLQQAYAELTGQQLSFEGDMFEALFNNLKSNEYIYALFHCLNTPLPFNESIQRILTQLLRKDRSSSEKNSAELLCYLALGAIAQKENNPLLRPKLHYFVKGLEGAVVAFEKTIKSPDHYTRLFLSKQEATYFLDYEEKAYLPLFVCKTCGQHYFESYNKGLQFDGKELKGGQAEGNNVIWLPTSEMPENRVVLTDRFVSELDDEDGNIAVKLDKSREEIFFCHYCGTLQKDKEDKCSNPKCKKVSTLVRLFIIPVDDGGKLISCISCKARSSAFGRTNEPIRPLRAITVADVHIMSQNMINAATKDNQKLIVFTDNRQDAAFQAGWMQDHARRYRFRHLIYQYLKSNDHPVSVGDLVDHLQKTLLADRSLASVLAPEVFELQKPEEYGHKFTVELNYYLRIQILRELGTSFNQKEGLEGWGLMKIEYFGIKPTDPWIKNYSEQLGISPMELADGIASLLDVFRRNRYLHDDSAPIYSKSWFEGDYEIQQGYLPLIMGLTNKPIPPKGIVENAKAKSAYQASFRAKKGQSLPENFINKWNFIHKDLKESFLDDLWVFLTDISKILVPVNLMGKNGRVLEANVYQMDVSKIGLSAYWGSYHCNICHRIHTRSSPYNVCTAMHCKGKVAFKEPSKDNYNIDLFSGEFSMIRPHEHTAQVPADLREKSIEPEFKKSNGKYNTLVATPTLELGVDIGALDMVLMRNMPPSPANYWQRAGRAGRRHRLAVIYTYSRRSKHDLYYFDEPSYMLNGVISTPKFNLHNEVMIRKHIHAVILSELLRLLQLQTIPASFNENDLSIIPNILGKAFPTFIKRFLFDASGNYLLKPLNIDVFEGFIDTHKDYFLKVIKNVFEQYWPDEDKSIITNELLTKYILETSSRLQEIIDLLHTRLLWAVHVQEKYINYQSQRLLNPEEEKTLYRCKHFLVALNQENRGNYTLNVLANEGFLPGYGLYDTGIKAFANMSFIGGARKPDFELSRPPFNALREFIPGNLIYANGGRFRNVLYHLLLDSNTSLYKTIQVNIEKKTLNILSDSSSQASYSDEKSKTIYSIPISDSDVQYISRISDEEVNRFQLPVVLMGKLAKGRRGGKVFSAGLNSILLIYGQKINMFNIGPSEKINTQLGYPVCTVCGATRSPFSSEAEITHFKEFHTTRCGREPGYVAFHAEDKVDGIFIHNISDDVSAINICEGIIMGASAKLEMKRNDLYSVIYRNNDDTLTLFIYDPMPGGSGLLDQIVAHWKQIIELAIENLLNCSNKCDDSCYNCMRTYLNSFFHDLLNRNTAAKLLEPYLADLKFEYDLEPEQEIQEDMGENKGTNKGERDLVSILIQYGFPTFHSQHRISIGPPFNSTVPDLFYEDEVKDIHIAIYLDGLSKHIHGNEERRKADILIRQQLEAVGYDVIEIAYSDLNDPEALKLSLKRIAAKLKRRDLFERINEI